MSIMRIIKGLLPKSLKRAIWLFRYRNMFIYRYEDSDGNFNYEKYKRIQIEGNRRKINSIWENEENIEYLSRYIKKNVKDIGFGICHGSRTGPTIAT